MTVTCGAESVTAGATATTQSRVFSVRAASALWTGPYLAAGLSAKMTLLNEDHLRARLSTWVAEDCPVRCPIWNPYYSDETHNPD